MAEKIKEGRFGVDVTYPDGKTERWDKTQRTLEVVGGQTVVTRHNTGTGEQKKTILPPGTKVTTFDD